MNKKMLPCPFCGGAATVRANEYYDGANTFYIYCASCGVQQMTTKIRTDEAIAAWNRRAQPANEPLTLEQLKQMDGEPVWCADGEGHSCYCLVNAESEDCIDSECGAWCFAFYGMTRDGENGLHNMGWLAYRTRPKEAQS